MCVNELELKGEVVYDIVACKYKEYSSNYNKLVFYCISGKVFEMLHMQDCCETVELEDVVGDLENLKDCGILKAEEVTEKKSSKEEWTYYKFATNKGYIDLRWYGTSNGCYAMGVDVIKIRDSPKLKDLIGGNLEYIKIDKENKEVKIEVSYCDEGSYIIKCLSIEDTHLKATSTEGISCFKEYVGENIKSIKQIVEIDGMCYHNKVLIELETIEILLDFYCIKDKSIYEETLILWM